MPEFRAAAPEPLLYDNRDYARSSQLPAEDGSLWGAAFRQENDVVNAAMFLGRPDLVIDDEFDLEAAMNKSDLALNNPNPFINATSQETFDLIEARLEQEQADRRTMEAGGWGGLFAGMVAGTLSPTVLLPGGAGFRASSALQGAKQAAGWSMLGTASQEAILQGNQEFRTSMESGLSVATSGLLTALIGGGIGYLGSGKMRDYTASPEKLGEERPAQNYNGARGVNAQYAGIELNDAGGLEGGVVIEGQGNLISPVIRTISQKVSPTARKIMGNLSSAGLKFEKNAAGITQAKGGDIESLVSQYDYFYVKASRAARTGYVEWAKANKRKRFNPANLKDYNNKVGEALFGGEAINEPGVEAGVKAFREMFETVLKEAKDAKLPGFENIENSDTYITRIVKKGLVDRSYADFVQVMKEHAAEVFREEATARINRAGTRIEARRQEIADTQLSAEDADKLRTDLEKEIFGLPEKVGGEAGDIAEQIRVLRAEARSRDLPKEERARLREEAKNLEKANRETLQDFTKQERALRRRFSNLDKNRAALEKKQRDVISQAERLEQDQLATMNRAIKSGQKLLDRMAKLSNERLGAELEKLEAQFSKAFSVFERGEERLAKLDEGGEVSLEISDVTPTDKISRQQAMQADRLQRAESVLKKLETAQDFDRAAARQAVTDAIAEANQRTVNTITRRGKRIDKLKERAAALDPKLRDERIVELEEEAGDIARKTESSIESEIGFSAKRLDARGLPEFDYEEAAEDWAIKYADMQTANATTLPNINLIQERGPMIKRTLNIDPNRVWSNGRTYREFLEQDVEIVGRRYIRAMAGDIELQRRFGSVNPLSVGGKWQKDITNEFAKAKADTAKNIKEEGEAAGLSPEAIEAKIDKAITKLNTEQADVQMDLEAVVGRLRHTWGIPDDPNGIAHRMGKVALNLNTLRFMGGVVIASVPDLAQPIIKHGLLRTFRNGWAPFVTNFKQMQMFKHELQAAGAALDVIMHSRSAGMFDVFAEIENGTKAERGLQQMTNKMGVVAMFDYWTSFMKQIAGATANAEITQSLDLLARQGGSLKARQQAERLLASVFIDREMAERIYGQLMLPGGSTRLNGALMPNTEVWEDVAAIKTYRAALKRMTEDTIVTPGVERPRWVDKTMTGRLIGQFRSFTYSTTTKTLLNGQQNMIYGAKQRDMQQAMQPIIGSMFSLALGAGAYYLWAQTRGGKNLAEMQNAGIDKWADEAILRSGLLGILGEVQKVGERTPITSSFSTISGSPTERSPFVQPASEMFGPTFGALLGTADDLLMNLGEPEELAKSSRVVMPHQNLFYLKLMERFVDTE